MTNGVPIAESTVYIFSEQVFSRYQNRVESSTRRCSARSSCQSGSVYVRIRCTANSITQAVASAVNRSCRVQWQKFVGIQLGNLYPEATKHIGVGCARTILLFIDTGSHIANLGNIRPIGIWAPHRATSIPLQRFVGPSLPSLPGLRPHGAACVQRATLGPTAAPRASSTVDARLG